MKLSGIQKRALRRQRNHGSLDLNLVSLIDIFTILIFFLMASSGVEVLSSSKAVKLPESTVLKAPRETLTIIVNNQDILVDGRKVASVADVLASDDDVIGALKTELELLATVRKSVRASNEANAQAITILGDKDIPYRLLRKIMVTAARANFSDIAFAVQRKVGSD